jgi:hypothetical protein
VDDPDWEDEEIDEQQQWQQQQRGRSRGSHARSQPPAAAGDKRRLGHSTSTSGGRTARATSRSPHAAAAVDAGGETAAAEELGTSSGYDFVLQQQPAKRPRSSQRTGRVVGGGERCMYRCRTMCGKQYAWCHQLLLAVACCAQRITFRECNSCAVAHVMHLATPAARVSMHCAELRECSVAYADMVLVPC